MLRKTDIHPLFFFFFFFSLTRFYWMHGSLAHSDNNCESVYRHVHTKKKQQQKKKNKKKNKTCL